MCIDSPEGLDVKKAPLVILACTVAVFCSNPAFAISKKVSSPRVIEQGSWKFEDFGDIGVDHGKDNALWTNEVELKYGALPWLELSASAKTKKPEGDNLDLDSTGIGAKFPLAPSGSLPVDLAAKIAYEHADNSGDPDKVKGQLLFGRREGKWEGRGKLTFEDEVGDDSEDAFEMGLGLAVWHKCTETISAGVEYYLDMGPFDADKSYSEQEHQIGPSIAFAIPGTPAKAKLGYLQGISRGAKDSTVKYEFDIEF